MNTTLRLFLVLILAFPSSLTAFPHSRDLSLSTAASTAPALTGLFIPGFFGPLFSGDPPTAVADSYSTDEDTPLEIAAAGVLGNDIDPEDDALTAILDTDVVHGVLVLSDDGAFTYVPAENYSGTDSFTYFADDGTGPSATAATVTITIDPVNDAPVAEDDSYLATEDTTLTITSAAGVLANDTDVEGNPFTAVLVDAPAFGTLTLNPNGSFVYEPDENANGIDSFTYTADDSSDPSNLATVTIDVATVNDRPTAGADSYNTNEDVQLNIAAPGVLNNDNDVDGDPITVSLVSTTTRGALTLNSDGSFNYLPASNLSGADSFTYTATDGSLASTPATTVNITVNAVNDPPVAVNDTYSVQEDSTLSVPGATGVLSNDTDVETSAQTAVLVSGTTHGTLSLDGSGSFIYTPTSNYNGPDSFTYRANDGAENSSNIGTVTISVTEVNDRPVANNDTYTTITEDTLFTLPAPGVLSNDTDSDTASLTAVLAVGPTRGTLNFQADGSFTYNPTSNLNGPDSFTYFANDATNNSLTPATVNLTVNAVNDLPVAVNDAYSTPEDTLLTVPAATGLLNNDTDVENSSLTVEQVQAPASGTLALSPDGSFTYTPGLNFNGSDSFTYRVFDGSNYSAAPATVTITVNAANDLPLVADDSYTTPEDTPLTVSAPGILSNDSDPDGTPITAVLVASTTQGSLSFNSNGGFTYTPNGNYAGSDSFTYRSSDGAQTSAALGTVTITVTPVNDPPTAVNDTYPVTEDTPLTNAASVLANDTDIDTLTLTAALVTTTTNGTLNFNSDGTFSYTPNLNINGSDSFTYTAGDGQYISAPATVTLNIGAANDRPVAVNDSYSINEDTPLTVTAPGLLANDTDVEGSALNAVLADSPNSGSLTLDANGSFTYTPNLNFSGTDSFTYNANDGNLNSAAPATVSITVNGVNDPPVAVNDSYTTAEDTTLAQFEIPVLNNDTDPENDPLTAILQTGPPNGSITLNINGTFTYTPNLNFHGTDTFTYNTQDLTLTSLAPATVTITVTPVNDRPVSNADTASVAEDAVLTVTAPGVLGNDTDIDADSLNAVLQNAPANGTLSLLPNGGYTYTPAANFFGTDSFTYFANDGTINATDPATVTITVTAVNDLPVAVADSTYTTAEDAPLSVAAPGVLANDTDIDGDPLTAVMGTGPSNGTLTLDANGSFLYTPTTDFHGTDTFTYRARDASGNSVETATVTITVIAANDLPVANANSYTTAEDTPLTVAAPGILSNDTDIDGDALTAVLGLGPTNGVLNLAANGGFTYTPNLNFNGSDSFTYYANDGTGSSTLTATVSITINAVNDAPVGNADTYPAFDEDTVLTVALADSVLNNDTDVDSTTLTAQIRVNPQHGSVTLDANGSFTYTPTLNYNGPDSFQYRASDGSLESADTLVNLTINPVNDAPVATTGSITTLEDTPVAITLAATDLETPANLTYSIVSQPTQGTLTGTLPSLTYTPNLNANGADSFTFQVQDPGALVSNIATFSITITPVNDAPVAVNDAYPTDEDTALTIALPGVLQNDTDVELSTLRAIISVQPQHGTLTLNSNGSFTYTPALNYNGTDTFRYFANDNQLNSATAATVTITIAPVNDAPVAVADANTTLEDTPINVTTGGLLGNDSDVDGNSITAAMVTGPLHGTLALQPSGLYTYTPNKDYNGTDSFTYRANDGSLNSNTVTVTITITPVNDAPKTSPKFYTVAVDGVLQVQKDATNENPPGLLDDASDVEAHDFKAVIVSSPLYGVLQPNDDGSFTYYANHSVVTDDSFSFRACELVPVAPATTVLCSPVTPVTIDIVNPDEAIKVNWVSPVTNNRRWYMGTEDITLRVDIDNCPGCGVRFYRWDDPTQQYVEIATVTGGTTHTFSSSILNTGPGRFDGWNQVIANAVLPSGGLASQRAYIWLIRMPFDGPAKRVYFPLGAGK